MSLAWRRSRPDTTRRSKCTMAYLSACGLQQSSLSASSRFKPHEKMLRSGNKRSPLKAGDWTNYIWKITIKFIWLFLGLKKIKNICMKQYRAFSLLCYLGDDFTLVRGPTLLKPLSKLKMTVALLQQWCRIKQIINDILISSFLFSAVCMGLLALCLGASVPISNFTCTLMLTECNDPRNEGNYLFG